jgi:hypothetical protein
VRSQHAAVTDKVNYDMKINSYMKINSSACSNTFLCIYRRVLHAGRGLSALRGDRHDLSVDRNVRRFHLAFRTGFWRRAGAHRLPLPSTHARDRTFTRVAEERQRTQSEATTAAGAPLNTSNNTGGYGSFGDSASDKGYTTTETHNNLFADPTYGSTAPTGSATHHGSVASDRLGYPLSADSQDTEMRMVTDFVVNDSYYQMSPDPSGKILMCSLVCCAVHAPLVDCAEMRM